MSEQVHPGDIIRKHWPQAMDEYLNLYLGSGRSGACFDQWGLMNNGARGAKKESPGNTVLMHADHWHRGAWGLDYWLPIARMMWATETPPKPQKYRQELRIVHGYLLTEMQWAGLKLTLVAHFNPARRDILAIHLAYESSGKARVPDLLLSPEIDIHTHYDQHLQGTASTTDVSSNFWLARIKAGNAESSLALRVVSVDGKATLSSDEHGATINFNGKRGSHLFLIGTASAARERELCDEMKTIRSAETYLEESIANWHQRWGDSEIDIPVPEYQSLYERSLYYLLCSFAPEVRSPAPPMGWSGNGWPFHFPQDVSYIHPALLRAGHNDIARSIVEFYRGELDTMRAYTQRIYKADGTMWAWEFPIGPKSELLKDGAPNWFQYEIHNAAYPARMAYETAQYFKNPQWSRDIAWPIVYESARFYGAVLKRESNGTSATWGMHVIPSMGQDEMGGQDAKNYLCALFSAQYCLKTALQMAKELSIAVPELAQWQTILQEGLAFKRLLDPAHGIYAACEGGKFVFGKQKHPVQLNPLTFLPLGSPDQPLRNAYSMRQKLCAGTSDEFYHGWTLAAYWLAASHSNDSQGLAGELGRALPARYVDKDWIQIYETSGALQSPYYLPSHGLYLQALNDALVSDYFGVREIGSACPAAWNEVSFANLCTADGACISGDRIGGRWELDGLDSAAERSPSLSPPDEAEDDEEEEQK